MKYSAVIILCPIVNCLCAIRLLKCSFFLGVTLLQKNTGFQVNLQIFILVLYKLWMTNPKIVSNECLSIRDSHLSSVPHSTCDKVSYKFGRRISRVCMLWSDRPCSDEFCNVSLCTLCAAVPSRWNDTPQWEDKFTTCSRQTLADQISHLPNLHAGSVFSPRPTFRSGYSSRA